jgi:hypothetical protein
MTAASEATPRQASGLALSLPHRVRRGVNHVLGAEDVMEKGPAKRLVVYVSEKQRWHHKPLWREVVDLCRKHGLAGTTATKGVVGFGHTGKMHESGSG